MLFFASFVPLFSTKNIFPTERFLTLLVNEINNINLIDMSKLKELRGKEFTIYWKRYLICIGIIRCIIYFSLKLYF